MTERHRSKDGSRDTVQFASADTAGAQQGRSGGGTLQRDIATTDEEKRAKERPAGATRVTKSNEGHTKNA